jgi:hypothetical protein
VSVLRVLQAGSTSHLHLHWLSDKYKTSTAALVSLLAPVRVLAFWLLVQAWQLSMLVKMQALCRLPSQHKSGFCHL